MTTDFTQRVRNICVFQNKPERPEHAVQASAAGSVREHSEQKEHKTPDEPKPGQATPSHETVHAQILTRRSSLSPCKNHSTFHSDTQWHHKLPLISQELQRALRLREAWAGRHVFCSVLLIWTVTTGCHLRDSKVTECLVFSTVSVQNEQISEALQLKCILTHACIQH